MIEITFKDTAEGQEIDESIRCEGFMDVSIDDEDNIHTAIYGNLSKSDIVCMIAHLIINMKESIKEQADDPLDEVLCVVLDAALEPLEGLVSLMAHSREEREAKAGQ